MATDANVGGSGGPSPNGNAWLDPRLVLALAPPIRTVVTLPAATTVQLLTENPSRVAFIVVKSKNLNTFPAIGPGSLADTYRLREDNTIDVRTFVLNDWVSLIVGSWWATSTVGGDVEVFEFQPRF